MAKINVHLQSINAQIIHLYFMMKGRVYAFEGGVQKKSSKETAGKSNTKQVEPALSKVPGRLTNNGLTTVWETGNVSSELSEIEMKVIRAEMGKNSLEGNKYVRALMVKQLMLVKTCAQIVRHFAGKKDYSERTIKRIHAALSKAGGGV